MAQRDSIKRRALYMSNFCNFRLQHFMDFGNAKSLKKRLQKIKTNKMLESIV